MGIRLKLVSLLLLFGFIILGAMLWSNQYVMHKTMLQYVDQRDQQRLERLQNNLEFYLERQQISDINAVPERIWSRLLRFSHRVDLKENPIPLKFILRERNKKRETDDHDDDDEHDDNSKSEREKKRKRLFGKDEFESRVTLTNAQGKLIFGTSLEESNMRLPISLNGQTVAMIGYHPLQKLIEQADIEFAESQSKLLSLGALFITLLALLLIWPLANHLLAPIKQLTKAMHKLTFAEFNHRLNVSRKDEFGQLQRDFNHLAKTLEASQNSRNQWIADISHELRTPLTVLNGSIEAMRDGIRPMNTTNLESLHQEVELLSRVIEDLYQLSLSDVGALQYAMTTLDLSQLLQQTSSQFSNKIEQKGLQLTLKDLPQNASIHGDSVRLQQLLNNLLQNAIDYTDASDSHGNQGQILVSLLEQSDNWVLCIEDSAPSVSADELELLKQRFYRAEASRNRRTGGTGLGLAMVNQVALGHNGYFTIELSNLGGIKSCITLPKNALNSDN